MELDQDHTDLSVGWTLSSPDSTLHPRARSAASLRPASWDFTEDKGNDGSERVS